ncbi:WbqC family protein [Galbibacter pacificus]|uniref:WbqC family protein n=1 Tax=Galbibacter pacificus TaxID=2996052 RepID=A0ABT6FP42_9FLAO|nr:WbqC family protein [Galbibacter pacificus]MDG3581351.1 WbqC family protein [Galbibacter pacificus]MDG3584829.1 WbqC family protein [Galbibacter pacificus]
MQTIIHPTYFPSVAHWVALNENEGDIIFEKQDNYQKQTYRNRTYIYSPNGKQLLSIPIKHTKGEGHQKYRDVMLEDSFDWKKQHWKSIQTAYRTSPFFEFYEDEFAPFFEKKHRFLYDMNLESIMLMADCLQLEIALKYTETYRVEVTKYQDLRSLVLAKKEKNYGFDPYTQVFDAKHGFIENLSGLDLLFNEGTNALSYLDQLSLEQQNP